MVKLGLIEDTATNRAGLSRRLVAPKRPCEGGRPDSFRRNRAPPTGAKTDMPRDLTEEEKDNLPF